MIKKKILNKILSTVMVSIMIVSIFETKIVNAESNSFMEKVASFSTGSSSEDGGAAEIVKYNKDNNKFYVINGIKSKIHIVSLDTNNLYLKADKEIDVKEFVEKDGFSYGDITSISINNDRKEIAVAVQEADYNKSGKIVIVDYDGNLKAIYNCGVQPDMITYTPDSKYLLTANEGEPRNGVGEGIGDPQGSVSIVNLESGESKLATFEKFDENREELLNNKVILMKGANPSVDLEPEYITVDSSSSKAYVSLQEANSIATLDIESGEFISVKGLGFKDHSKEGNEIDVVKDKEINIKIEENLYGVYMPDSITLYEANGQKYILTANEGDAREFGEFNALTDIKIGGKKVEVLDSSKFDGLDADKNYILGGRSFSIWNADTMELVYDSGSEFEKITAEKYPDYFNTTNKEIEKDNRSGKKGPEPEEVRIGNVGDKTYAFIGLERIGGIMAYDITDPNNITFKDYINTRDFNSDIAGDVAPEGIDFIGAEVSPIGYPLLLVACEVSGTVAVMQINEGYIENEKEITIFHTNDVHSRVDNYSKVKAYIDNYENKLLVDAGDTFHGQSIATLESGSSIAKILRAMGYSAMVPGNHDFNYGQDRLNELGVEAGVEILASNVKLNGVAKYSEYTIEEVDGVKIGIFGLATPETAYKTNPNNVSDLDFGNMDSIVKDAENMVEKLNDENVDVIVALSHLGIDSDSKVKATDIAKAVDGIDLIIDGHSHSILESYTEFNKISDTKVTSTGEYLKNLGQVEITLDDNLEIKDIKLETIDTSTLTEEDLEISELINSIKDGQKEILNEVVGNTPIDLDGLRINVRSGHTNLGRLITSAMINETGADIAITNGGGIRDSIKAGDITKDDVIKVLPFGNYIVTKNVKGSDIIAALEHGMVEGAGSFTHFAGMVVETIKKTDSDGVIKHKILSVKVNGNDIDVNKEYTIATNDFMAVGGDGYTMFSNYPTLNEYSALDESLIKYIEKVGSEGIISVDKEERLVVKTSDDIIPGEEESDDKKEDNKNDQVVVSPDNNDKDENSNNKLPQTGGRNVIPILALAAIMIIGGAVIIRKKKII
ncbi:choice-of-anchor I family protein [Clostridioides difficile]